MIKPKGLQGAALLLIALWITTAAAPQKWDRATSKHTAYRRLLQQADDAQQSVEAWLHNSTCCPVYPAASSSCFPRGKTYEAAGIKDFVRLIKDPSVSQIQLVADLFFPEDLFPPQYAHDITKGINVSHEVEIRACTSREAPIIVDVNNVTREVYVDGRMTWQGTIKFINSFPSPRRAGLFPLISVLSVEGAGAIVFKGVQIQGYEPSALFNDSDPYWEVHNDPAFAPQPHQYVRLGSHAMIMKYWYYNRTAWLLHSQGPSGLIQSTGDGYWQWVDVLITWVPPPSSGAGGLTGSALALAVALPVVFGTLLVAAGAALLLCCCRRRALQQQNPSSSPKQIAGDDEARTSLEKIEERGPSFQMPSWESFSGDSGPRSGDSGLRVDSSALSFNTKARIEATRLAIRQSSASGGSLVIRGLLGEGTFGRVYAGNWKGTAVAVKTMLLPAAMSGKERREKMAIMETAISSSLSHPNIVQTYTYAVKPLSGELARQCQSPASEGGAYAEATPGSSYASSLDDSTSSSDDHGWEVRLVLELCERGNLQEFFVQGGFEQPTAQLNVPALVATAQDIARAMVFLHTENIIHGDLKARNVLLKSAGADVRGFVAKVSDFGLSMRIDPSETHVSNFYQGTLTHMAPEVLMYGKISFASDVYAFGIMLWEMYTAQQAFKGVPRALLGHEVARAGKRPEFPPDCPFDYQLLACRCWESDPAIRPTFEQILAHLQNMSRRLQGADSAPGSLQPASLTSSVCGSEPLSGQAILGHLGHPRNAAKLKVTAASAAGVAADGAEQHSAADPSASAGATESSLSQSTQLGATGSASTSAGAGSQPGVLAHRQHAIELQTLQAAQQQQQQQQQPQQPQQAAVCTGVDAPARGQPLQPAISLGSWEAPSGAEMWPSGSFAPEELQHGALFKL